MRVGIPMAKRAAAKIKPAKKLVPDCYVCGDTGNVLRAYVEPTAMLPRAKGQGELPEVPKREASRNACPISDPNLS